MAHLPSPAPWALLDLWACQCQVWVLRPVQVPGSNLAAQTVGPAEAEKAGDPLWRVLGAQRVGERPGLTAPRLGALSALP